MRVNMIQRYLFGCLLMLFTQTLFAQSITNLIVVDQFGYRENSEKIAVIRDPQVGFDSSSSLEPASTYSLVNSETNETVYEASITIWNGGQTDDSSGDKAWWFDFTDYTTPGTYYILDSENNIKSFDFVISDNVYAEVLKHAMRTFYYQRAGYSKEVPFTDEAWADLESHLGSLQDSECRKFDSPGVSSSERDLQGGWYDAGDYNKYTPWTANYIIEFIQAYNENPEAWGDNYCLPYSDNGIPDIIDEIKWGLDYLLRLQEDDGSLISVVSLDHAYPPSDAKGQSLYGGVNTTSALSGAAAYAFGAKFFLDQGQEEFGNTLLSAAEAAWSWADQNPNVIWKNNDAEYNSVGIGAGQQETDDYGRLAYKFRAAVYLFEATGKQEYHDFIQQNYQSIHLLEWTFAYPFEESNQEALLYYSNLPNANQSIAETLKSTYQTAMQGENNFNALNNERDPYLAYLSVYVWGSNSTKARKALMFTDYVHHNVNAALNDDALRAAERYVHYIHGLNPLNFCYLSNMYDYGADQGVTQFYHTWFADESDWDITGVSKYGPAPGFVVGGANPSYDWDNCCTSSCTSNGCDSDVRADIVGQPDQKSYLDFNTSWPMNSWSLSENSCGYQTSYIRLLSKFVNAEAASSVECEEFTEEPLKSKKNQTGELIYPNPASGKLQIQSADLVFVEIIDLKGATVLKSKVSNDIPLDISHLENGTYSAKYFIGNQSLHQKIIIKN